MIDTDSLIDNEKSKGATKTNIVTVPKNLSINKQDNSEKKQSGNQAIFLYDYLIISERKSSQYSQIRQKRLKL